MRLESKQRVEIERNHRIGQPQLTLLVQASCRSNAWLSHIENGYANVPIDHGLEAILVIYGSESKSFNEQEARKQPIKQRKVPLSAEDYNSKSKRIA